MKLFSCPTCDATVYFDSLDCESCGTPLVYRPEIDAMSTAAQDPRCANGASVEACNWISADGEWCVSCALDRDHTATTLRAPFQAAKRRTVRQLIMTNIHPAQHVPGLAFDLVGSGPGETVTTGHRDGLITLDVAEADPAVRARVRVNLGETYRTPLGHVRHEIGHWFWAAGIGDRFTTDEFRAKFGDESVDYTQALERHYASQDDGSWTEKYISHYAAAHPWEDFAESFAHVLHITDTLETAASYGLAVTFGQSGFADLYAEWVELGTALNDLNRSMGMPDAYPFVVSPPAISKLEFVTRLLRQ